MTTILQSKSINCRKKTSSHLIPTKLLVLLSPQQAFQIHHHLWKITTPSFHDSNLDYKTLPKKTRDPLRQQFLTISHQNTIHSHQTLCKAFHPTEAAVHIYKTTNSNNHFQKTSFGSLHWYKVASKHLLTRSVLNHHNNKNI